MMYKLTKVTDLHDVTKTDEAALNRLDRILSLDAKKIIIGKSLFMECLIPGFLKSIITSPVKKVSILEGKLLITTTNSIYHLEELIKLGGENGSE